MEPQTYLITGAAGGIGTAICTKLLDENHTVLGIDINSTVSTLFPGHNFTGIQADVLDAKELAQIAESIGDIHHIITSSGIALPSESQNNKGFGIPTPEVFAESVNLNLISHYNILHAFLPNLMRASGNRSVTLVSSINAIQGFGLPAYSSAKAGLSGLVVSLVKTLGSHGIRINALLPGTTPTPATLEEWAHVPDHWETMKANAPLKKLGTPEDIANSALALTQLMTHVTGQCIVVDGGQVVGR